MRKKLDELHTKSKKPVFIFDLDGTLFNVNYRHIAIMRKLTAQSEFRNEFKEYCAAIDKLSPGDFLYSIEASLNRAGITRYSEHSAQFIRQVENFWFKHFFTDEYVLQDEPYSGAVACVKHYHQQGAQIVYLSGRDIPNMSRGTIGALEKYGFPHSGHQVTVCLKPAYGLDDYLFKKQSLEAIRTEGTVIATFDNEPANVDLFIKEFPEAMNFHFDTQYAREMQLSGASFYRIKSFEELGF